MEIRSVEGRNLSPFFSHDITDVYSASTNPNGYWFWFSTEATYTQKDNGWVHVAYSNTGNSAVYPNCIVQQVPALKNGASYTFMVEIANATISGDVKFSPNGSAGSTVAYLNNVTAFSIANNSTYYKSTTAKSDFSGCNRFTRSYFNVPAGGSISLDLRISIYEGGYAGAYQPYQSITAAITGKNLLNTSITEATYSGVTYTQGNSGEIVLNGTKYGGGYAIVKQDAFSLQAGTYTFSAELVSGTATTTPTIYLLGNNDAVVFQVTPNAGSKKSHTVTLAEDTNIIKLRFGLFTDNSVYTNATYALQLELGSEATDYEPYTDASAYIPLRGNPPAVVPPTVSLGNGNFITTDSYEDFTKDFCLFIGFFRVAASRHCFVSPYNSLPGVGIELTTGGLVRVYSVADTGVVTDKSLGTAVGIGSQCRFALMWSATAKMYTWLSVHDGLRESGTFAPNGSYTGTSTNPLRMGGDFRDATGGKSAFSTS